MATEALQAPLASDDAHASEHVRLIEDLFREHNEALLRFLQTRLRSPQEARDVAQEAYVRLLGLHEPGAVSYLRAFLFQTAANLALDRMRREQVHHRATQQPLFHEFVDHCTPERRLSGTQDIEFMEKLLESLPPKCRQAFLLSRCYGMDFDAIAKEMGLKPRMVRTYVVRALLYCRSRMDAEAARG